jgi:hypothetical protein
MRKELKSELRRLCTSQKKAEGLRQQAALVEAMKHEKRVGTLSQGGVPRSKCWFAATSPRVRASSNVWNPNRSKEPADTLLTIFISCLSDLWPLLLESDSIRSGLLIQWLSGGALRGF